MQETRFTRLRSLVRALISLIILEIGLTFFIYLIIPYFLGSFAYESASIASYFAGYAPSSNSQMPFFALSLDSFIFSIHFYFGVVIVVISFIALISSLFSLGARIIFLALSGFLSILFAGYAWILIHSGSLLATVGYPVAMETGLVLSLILYELEMRVTR